MTNAGKTVVEGTFTETAEGTAVAIQGHANVLIGGSFVATVQVQKSFDGGVTWFIVSRDSAGALAEYTSPGFNGTIIEPESQILYRVECTAFTSGTVIWRISRNASLGNP